MVSYKFTQLYVDLTSGYSKVERSYISCKIKRCYGGTKLNDVLGIFVAQEIPWLECGRNQVTLKLSDPIGGHPHTSTPH